MIPLRDWLVQSQRPGLGLATALAEALAPREPGPNPAAAIAEAYDRGRAESDCTSQELLQRTIAEERQRNAEEMHNARQTWRSADVESLASGIALAVEALHEMLARQTAAALAGFLEGGARAKALNAFRKALDDLAENHSLIRLEGPEELIAALQQLGSLPAGVELKPSAEPGLRAIAGDTMIKMALKRWLEALHGEHP